MAMEKYAEDYTSYRSLIVWYGFSNHVFDDEKKELLLREPVIMDLAARKESGIYYYVLVGRNTSGNKEHTEVEEFTIPGCDNVTVFVLPISHACTDKHTQFLLQNSNFIHRTFSWQCGCYPIDVVEFSVLAQGTILWKLLRASEKTHPIFVFIDIMLRNPERIYNQEGDVLEEQDIEVLTRCYSVFLTEQQREFFRRRLIDRYHSYIVRNFLDRNTVIPNVFNSKKLSSIKGNKQKKMCFCGRLSSMKGIDFILKIAKKAFVTGEIEKLVMTTQYGKSKKVHISLPKNEKWIEVNYGLGNPEYLEKVAGCSYYIHAQSERDFGLNVTDYELLYIGVLGVYPKWLKPVLPKWYPFFYRDEAECLAIIEKINKNDEAVNAIRKSARKWCRDNFSVDVIETKEDEFYDKVFRETFSVNVFDKNNFTVLIEKYRFLETLVEFIKTIKGQILWSEFRNVLKYKKLDKAFVLKNGRIWFTNHDLYRLLLRMGYRDLCNYKEPIFVKEEDGK